MTTMAAIIYSRSSDEVNGRIYSSVPGLGMCTLHMWCSGCGKISGDSERVMMLVSVMNHSSGRLEKNECAQASSAVILVLGSHLRIFSKRSSATYWHNLAQR